MGYNGNILEGVNAGQSPFSLTPTLSPGEREDACAQSGSSTGPAFPLTLALSLGRGSPQLHAARLSIPWNFSHGSGRSGTRWNTSLPPMKMVRGMLAKMNDRNESGIAGSAGEGELAVAVRMGGDWGGTAGQRSTV